MGEYLVYSACHLPSAGGRLASGQRTEPDEVADDDAQTIDTVDRLDVRNLLDVTAVRESRHSPEPPLLHCRAIKTLGDDR